MPANHQRRIRYIGRTDPERPRGASPSRTDALANGELIEVDPRLAHALGFTAPLAVTAHVWTEVITHPDEPTARGGQDLIATLLDLLTQAAAASRIATVAAVPFTVYRRAAAGGAQPVNLTIATTTGDHGETVQTIDIAPTPPAGAFGVAGQPDTWPALHFHHHPGDPGEAPGEAQRGATIPVVTRSVLIVLLAQQIDNGAVSVAHLNPGRAGTVRLVDNTGHLATLRPQADGTYDLACLAQLGWQFTRAA